MERLKELVRDLTNLQGNVGYEDKVRTYIVKRLRKLSHIAVSVDSIGNITIHVTPENRRKDLQRVMLFGHTDEVGMMVKRIDEDGFIQVEKLGSVNPTALTGLKVQLQTGTGTLNGVIGVKSHHLLQGNDRNHVSTVQNIYIDVGAKNRESVLKSGVDLGTVVSYKPQFIEMLDNCVSNKSMDDRALLAALMLLIETLDPSKLACDLYVVMSVQEEFNTRGIMPAVREIRPQVVIGLDVTPATDTPDLKGYSEIILGNGPALTYMNHHSRGTLAGLVPNKKFLDYLNSLARQNGFTLQKEIATGILTETAYIAIEKTDTVVANISLPTRYTHTPVEVISLEDLEQVYKLIYSFCSDFDSSRKFGKNYDIESLKEDS